jgi:DNA-binding transcriptional regulator YiaG
MRYEELPITPALIKWARARAGISVEEASKTFKRIQAWEDGQAFPTYPQLELLADAFKGLWLSSSSPNRLGSPT